METSDKVPPTKEARRTDYERQGNSQPNSHSKRHGVFSPLEFTQVVHVLEIQRRSKKRIGKKMWSAGKLSNSAKHQAEM
jgi:hypothetical protein